MLARVLTEASRQSVAGRSVFVSVLFPAGVQKRESLMDAFYGATSLRSTALRFALCGPVIEPASTVAHAVQWTPGLSVEDFMARENVRCMVLADEVHKWTLEHSDMLAKMAYRNPRLSIVTVGLQGEHETQSPLMALPNMVRIYPPAAAAAQT